MRTPTCKDVNRSFEILFGPVNVYGKAQNVKRRYRNYSSVFSFFFTNFRDYSFSLAKQQNVCIFGSMNRIMYIFLS